MKLQEIVQREGLRSKYRLYQSVLDLSDLSFDEDVKGLLLEIEGAGALGEFQDYLIELHKPEYITEFYGKYFNEGA